MSTGDIRSFFNKRKRSESPEFFQPPKKHDVEDVVEVPSYELQPHSELITDIPIPEPFVDRTNNFRRNGNLPDKQNFSSESSEEDGDGNQKHQKCQNEHEHNPSSEDGEVTFNLVKSKYPSKEFSEESNGSEDPNANEAPKEERLDLKTDEKNSKDNESVKNAKSEDEAEEYEVEFILDYQWCKERVSSKAAAAKLLV